MESTVAQRRQTITIVNSLTADHVCLSGAKLPWRTTNAYVCTSLIPGLVSIQSLHLFCYTDTTPQDPPILRFTPPTLFCLAGHWGFGWQSARFQNASTLNVHTYTHSYGERLQTGYRSISKSHPLLSQNVLCSYAFKQHLLVHLAPMLQRHKLFLAYCV